MSTTRPLFYCKEHKGVTALVTCADHALVVRKYGTSTGTRGEAWGRAARHDQVRVYTFVSPKDLKKYQHGNVREQGVLDKLLQGYSELFSYDEILIDNPLPGSMYVPFTNGPQMAGLEAALFAVYDADVRETFGNLEIDWSRLYRGDFEQFVSEMCPISAREKAPF